MGAKRYTRGITNQLDDPLKVMLRKKKINVFQAIMLLVIVGFGSGFFSNSVINLP